MFQDLRFGLRLMLRKPGFAAIAVATLALGIGTTTAIFAVTDHVLLRPVPYADPARLAAKPVRVAAALEDVRVHGRLPVARCDDGRRRAGAHSRGACDGRPVPVDG